MKWGAGLDEAFALPGVHGAAFGLVGGHAHGDSVDFADIFDLDIAIAKAEKLFAAKGGIGDEALDQDAFGKGAVIIERAEHAAIEVGSDAQQIGLFAHVNLVSAAGQIHFETALAQGGQDGIGAGTMYFSGET